MGIFCCITSFMESQTVCTGNFQGFGNYQKINFFDIQKTFFSSQKVTFLVGVSRERNKINGPRFLHVYQKFLMKSCSVLYF